MKPQIKILLVEDDEIMRLGLRSLFDQFADVQVIGEAGGAAAAIEAVGQLEPEIVLLDVRLPDGSGVEVCREIRSRYPQVKVLFLTAFEDQAAITAAVVSGAQGFLKKGIAGEALINAIRSVAAGQSILDPVAAQSVSDRMNILASSAAEDERGRLLSPQEKRVLKEVAAGKTNKEVAAALKLSDKTVRNYLSSVFQKLEITRRSQAVAYVMRKGVD